MAIGLLLAVSSLSTAAGETSEVTLIFNDGDAITGTLLEYSGSDYKITTSVGNILIPAGEVRCIGEGCPEGTETAVADQNVLLETLDETTTIAGQLLDLTESEYVVGTAVGELRIGRDTVRCHGTACPKDDLQLDQMTVTMVGQGVRVEGILVNQTEYAFTITTPTFGDVNFSKLEFSCEGLACSEQTE